MSSSLQDTCLIKPGIGTLTCWGENIFSNCDVPAHVKIVESVFMGAGCTCAISLTDSLDCWGRNDYHQLDITREFTTDVKVVAMDGYRTCVVKHTGHIKCFGDNLSGFSDVPQILSTNVDRVYSGMNHICTLMLNGKLYSWGELIRRFIKPFVDDPKIKTVSMGNQLYALIQDKNQLISYNQFGKEVIDHSVIKKRKGILSQQILWFSSYTFLNKGSLRESVCQINLSRKLICSQLGSENKLKKFEISDLFQSDTITYALGGPQVCAMHLQGTVECYTRYSYSLVTLPPNLKFIFNNIKAGFNHQCTNKGVTFISCTGVNFHSQLEVPQSHVESQVESLATGYLTTCAINNSGLLSCWGRGKDGLTGKIELFNRDTQRVLNLNNATLSLTNRHACVLTIGNAQCWGWNKQGQLNVGNMGDAGCTADNGQQDQYGQSGNRINNQNNEGRIVRDEEGNELVNYVEIDVMGGTQKRSVNAGGGHTCFIERQSPSGDDTNDTKCIGLNLDGQSSVPASGTISTNGLVVQAGYKHSCLLNVAAVIVCWGRNTHSESDSAAVGQFDDARLGRFHHLRLGRAHTCGLQTVTMLCFGSDRQGQSAVPAVFKGHGVVIVKIEANYDVSCAIDVNGRLKCWGKTRDQGDDRQ